MSKDLPRHDLPTLITVFLALGGIGMMIIFCVLIGFGLHTIIGKIAVYLCFALQVTNVLVMTFRRHVLLQKYHAPAESKKMKRFTLVSAGFWLLGALSLIASLLLDIVRFEPTDAIVFYTCLIGGIVALIGWIGLLAAFHRRRQAAIFSQK